MNDNKNSYFKMVFKTTRTVTSLDEVESIREDIEDTIEPILSRIGATEETYVVYNENTFKRIVFLVKTENRKRISFIRNSVNKFLPNINSLTIKDKAKYIYQTRNKPLLEDVIALTKIQFIQEFENYKQREDITVKGELDHYKGKDLEIFKDRKNWYPWQKKLYDLLYTKHNTIREANDREIIFIECSLLGGGKTGKSKFFKWMYTKDKRNILILSEATSSQLRSSVTKSEGKKIILIDLPRTASDIGYNGLMNSLETAKNGLGSDHMYGSTDVLCVEPPHIVICGNRMPEGCWTPDRWVVYEINKKTKDWKDVSKPRRKRAEEIIKIENSILNESINLKKLRLKAIQDRVKKELRVL